MLYVMNTTVVPSGCDGIWEAIAIPLESAKLNLQEFSGWESAVGHNSTAALMGGLLGTTVPVSRIQVIPKPGDRLLCFKLKGRAPEGVILSKEEIEKIGYEWVLLLYHGTVGRALDHQLEQANAFTQRCWQRI
jgi:hypothetical protein